MPELAVCMPVFNAAPFMERTVSQVLAQTFPDFTFLITDDGSTDRTFDAVRNLRDPRIVLFRNARNLGAVSARNAMLAYCIEHGFEYMALMDADDLMHPRRLERQLDILSKDPSLAVCGSSMKIERTGRIWHAPARPADIKALCIFANPIPTPTATIRLRYMQMHDLKWSAEYAPCADYHLWYRMLFEHNLSAANTGSVDMVYSHSPEGISHGGGIEAQERMDMEVKKCILRHFNLELSTPELHGFMKVALYRSRSAADAPSFLNVSRKLIGANRDRVVSDDALRRLISHRAFVYLAKCRTLSPETRAEIRAEFLMPLSAVLIELEAKLEAFRHRIADRPLAAVAHYLAFICGKARSAWAQIRRKAA
jgi:glycosyltransferase involved in cell wall biosynthesis